MMANRDIEVLIVEDDLRIAEIQKLFIEKLEGFQTIGIASSYDEAKSFIEIMQPDLLLLDMYFPDMNGLDILKEIKQQSKQMDVIMITAAKEIEKVHKLSKSAYLIILSSLSHLNVSSSPYSDIKSITLSCLNWKRAIFP